MKPFFLILFLLGSLCLHAQGRAPLREPDPHKPLLFATLPSVQPVQPEKLEVLLGHAVGDTVTFQLSPALRVTGVVTSVSDGSDKTLSSVVIRSQALGGATFSFARRIGGDDTEYTGRLLSYNHGDALELVRENGKYRLEKRGLYDLLSE
ncbi:hypothetical protein EPD60_13300 [Flaviaesturariibacter flavus]|uniref:Uncharacterized protein n=1 Tax=Flaviaesturariibacter flavus TaxID=2502780 RepID=A0A4R1B996_9BACT|nr:hypothetical protein [Flaviaesturariibacter flavus]TCJ13359.1 hypothetical protein EPD60_13300 [Flaviaesturariibacter flavus]